MNLLQIIDLGSVDYGTALQLQETLVELRKQDRIADTMLLLEHPPVITLGRNAKERNIVASPEFLAQRGVEVFEINRGGDVTFHGPGQLVGYPICDLRGLSTNTAAPKIGAVEFVRRLEEVLIRVCADFGIASDRVPGLTGVWADAARKVAAIGVHISRGVTSHGFALNVTTDLKYFDLIVPCGITGKPVTSMEQEFAGREGKPLEMQAVKNAVTRQFGNVFGMQVLWLESLDALLSDGKERSNDEPADPANQDDRLREPDDLKRMREEWEKTTRDDVAWG
jgi:lipoyl(octanoyl) transferase